MIRSRREPMRQKRNTCVDRQSEVVNREQLAVLPSVPSFIFTMETLH